ncbi:MAG: hypothetical protein R2831_02780 [Chitinophagaceae bacterium]
MLRHFSILFIISCFVHTNTHGQILQVSLENETRFHDSVSNQVFFHLDSKVLFKNNEYFNPLVEGYTLFSNQLDLGIQYQISPYVQVSAHTLLQKDVAYNTQLKAYPLLRLTVKKNGYSLIAGSILPHVSHKLLDALYAYERLITNPYEQGIQIKIEKKHIWSDTWLLWEQMQYPQSPLQEKFLVGHSSVLKTQYKKSSLSIPIQGVVSHRGGQIGTSNLPTISQATVGIGFQFSYQLNRFIKDIYTENYFLLSKELGSQLTSGKAIFANIGFRSQYGIQSSIGYWQGHDFVASHGAPIFQSVASQLGTPFFYTKKREILFWRFLYQHELAKSIFLDIRLEPYYDFGFEKIEYTYGAYIRYVNDIHLLNVKKTKQY